MKLIQISLNKQGAYFMYQIEVARGLHGKNKGHVKEVLITGIPYNKVEKYCEQHNLIITNMTVYESDLNNPILFKKKDSWTYVEKELL